MSKKISELDELTTTATNDIIEIVDVSDTSEALTGTNKKLQLSNIDITASQVTDFDTEVSNNTDVDASKTKTDFITVTQAVDLDTMETDVGLNNTHRSSDGTDHSYIDQDVTTTASPTFDGANFTGRIYGDATNPYVSLTNAGGSSIGYTGSNNYNLLIGSGNIRLRQNTIDIANFSPTIIDFETDLNVDGDVIVNGTQDIVGTAAKLLDIKQSGSSSGDSALIDFQDRATIGYDGATGNLIHQAFGGKGIIYYVDETTEAMRILDTGEVGIGTASPDSLLHLESGGATTLTIEGSNADQKTVIKKSGVSQFVYGYDNTDGDFKIERGEFLGLNNDFVIDSSNGNVGIGTTSPGAKLEIQDDGTNIGCLIDMNGNNNGLVIDSEATSKPLIDLSPHINNTRGDIAFSTVRTSDPSSPSEGDMWYNSTDNQFKGYNGTSVVVLG